MPKPVIHPETAKFFVESPWQVFTAVMFRRRLYVAGPRHMDAIELAFKEMTDMQVHHVSNRIADGKEKMLFGTAMGDGSGWEHDEKYTASCLPRF